MNDCGSLECSEWIANLCNTFLVFASQVTVLDLRLGSNQTGISIGVAKLPYPRSVLIGVKPYSIGYDSSGRACQNDRSKASWLSSYSKGDVIGCGYNPETGGGTYPMESSLPHIRKMRNSYVNHSILHTKRHLALIFCSPH